MKFKIALFSTITGLFFIVVELLLSLLSSPGCGTNLVDHIPCAYTDRLLWNLEYGSWIVSAVIWIMVNIIFITVVTQRHRKN